MKCFSSLEGSEVGSHPYEPPVLTKLDPHLPTEKTQSAGGVLLLSLIA